TVSTLSPVEDTVTEGDNVELAWTLSLNNASASPTTLQLDLNNLGNKGSFTDDTNGIFILYSADGTRELNRVDISDNTDGIVELVIPPEHHTVQIKTQVNNDVALEGTETLALKVKVKDTGNWTTADSITLEDDEGALSIASTSVYQHGQEDADGYTDGPAWEIRVSHPADKATTFNINFNDQDYNSSFGKFEAFIYV
ncbi:hypothetical protein, partial [Veronia pacifica]